MTDTALKQAELIVRTVAQTAVDNETYFCELDAVVGDGDFGYSLARGFEIVLSDWDAMEYSDPAGLLKKTAITLSKRIGGTSGPIWGTAFLRAGGSLNDTPEPTGEQVIAALRAAIEGIKQRGKAELGDKTLLDALAPAVDELEATLPEGAGTALERAAVKARVSAEATKGMLAMRGRASYTGERSRDSVDAGAVGVAVMFEAVSKAWRESELEQPDRRSGASPTQGGGLVKKFVNDPQNFVPEMLKGIELANPGKLRYVPEYNLIMRTDAPRDDKVSIVQGSGSGHEPAHVMAVGPGMLDAACPGDVFAAPPSDYVYETTKLMASPKGVLHLINNYTGDLMSFEMGRELAEAEDIKIATIVIDDDVAVKDSTYTVGRRGVAGNFFVIKAVGAASENGASLEELVELGNRVNSVTRTMGMALTSCTPPAKGSPLFELGDDEMEMGVGIHGEPGRRREKLASANEIVDELLDAVASDLPYGSGDEVALMINGLGGTPISELYILYGRAAQQLADKGINVTRSYVGEYCTSLDMAGASLTLVKLDDELNALFDAPAEVAVRIF